MEKNTEIVVEKLKKIIALAKGKGATEAEVNLAIEKASQLAAAHNLDLASITSDNGETPEIEIIQERVFSRADGVRPHFAFIYTILKVCFDVEIVHSLKSSYTILIGDSVDVKCAACVWTLLDKAFPKLLNDRAKKLFKLPAASLDSHFRESFYMGLRDGIVSANKRIRKVATESAKPGKMELVLFGKKEKISDFIKKLFGETLKEKVNKTYKFKEVNRAIYDFGRIDGEKIKFNSQLENGEANETFKEGGAE